MTRTSVLLVDDSPTARAALSQALHRRGYEVTAVSGTSDLEAALAARRHDLYLVDVHLQDMFGDDLVVWLREERKIGEPILLCSTRSVEELQRLAEACGADGWIRKNARPDEVAALVERHLAGGEI